MRSNTTSVQSKSTVVISAKPHYNYLISPIMSNSYRLNTNFLDSRVISLNNSFQSLNSPNTQQIKYDINVSVMRFWILMATTPFVLALGLFNNSVFPSIITNNDKIVHLSVFFIETFLYLKTFLKFQVTIMNKYKLNIAHLFLVTCIFGGCVFSEFLQHWINPNRSFDLYDMLFNIVGSSLGYLLYIYIHDN